MKRLILLILTATVLNSALLTIKPVEKIETTTLRKSYFDGPEDYYDRFYERPNDWPNLATNPYTFSLVSREEAETNDYQFHLEANLFHDYYYNYPDGSYSYYPDNDFYLLNVFYTSDIEITLSNAPSFINNGDKVSLQLFRYSNYFESAYQNNNPIYFIQGGLRVDEFTIKLTYLGLPSGDYCIRVGSTPNYNETYLDRTFYYNLDKYQLDVSVQKTSQKHKISEGKISIGEMQYNLGAYGAIWKADLTPFGNEDIIYSNGKPSLRILSNNFNDLISTTPLSQNKYNDSVYKLYAIDDNKDYLTSKIYIWDPLVLSVLYKLFSNPECRELINSYINGGILDQQLRLLKEFVAQNNRSIETVGIIQIVFEIIGEILDRLDYFGPIAGEVGEATSKALTIACFCIDVYSSILESLDNYLKDAINDVDEKRACYRKIEMFLESIEEALTNEEFSSAERKGICIHNYVNITDLYKFDEGKSQLKLNYTSHVEVRKILEKDINYVDNDAVGDGTGTIYLLRDFNNLENELEEIHNFEQYLPNLPKIWDYYETIPINERTYASESKEYVLHDGEFKWHSLKNTGFQTKTYRVVLDSLSDIEVSGEAFDALYFEGYSNKNAISEFTVANTGTTKRKVLNITIEPRYTMFFKVHISNWNGLPVYDSTVKYQIGLDNDYTVPTDDFALYKARDFGFACEYNNIFENSIKLNHGSVYGAKYSRLRCGYIEESEFNRKYLTLSSQSQKYRTVDTAFLDITFDRSVIKASVDLAAWSANENFNENSRVIISVLVDDYEMQYRNLPISYIGPNKDHLSRFYVDPGFSFDGIEIKVVSNTNVKPERKNAGRVVLDNLYFEFE